MRFVFDTNSVITGASKQSRGLLAPVFPLFVPLIVVQELLHQLVVATDTRSAGRPRSALRALHSHQQLEIGPGFADVVRAAFGESTVAWPRQAVGWRRLIDRAVSGADRLEIRAGWGALADANPRVLSFDLFARMKATTRGFATDYIRVLDELMPEGKAELAAATERRSDAGGVLARMEASRRRVAWMCTFTEVAAMAGVRDAAPTLDAMRERDDPDSGRLRVDLANRLLPVYRGGLDLVLGVMSVSQATHISGATRPQVNDCFDLFVLASVDDRGDTIFVTEENAWHRAASLAGYGHRVVKWAAVAP